MLGKNGRTWSLEAKIRPSNFNVTEHWSIYWLHDRPKDITNDLYTLDTYSQPSLDRHTPGIVVAESTSGRASLRLIILYRRWAKLLQSDSTLRSPSIIWWWLKLNIKQSIKASIFTEWTNLIAPITQTVKLLIRLLMNAGLIYTGRWRVCGEECGIAVTFDFARSRIPCRVKSEYT